MRIWNPREHPFDAAMHGGEDNQLRDQRQHQRPAVEHAPAGGNGGRDHEHGGFTVHGGKRKHAEIRGETMRGPDSG
ncbi:hypothetical protein QW131_30755 [Roseibium salinum]|nr:hypothetical protein [Roseibium salinum]